MANIYDQFDVTESEGNVYDQFDDAEVEAGAKPKEKGGFFASAKQSIGSAIKGAGQLAGDLPGIDEDNAVKRYGQSVIDSNPTDVRSLGDIADKPWMATKEAVGNAVGSIGGMAGARALGMGITAAAPLTGPAAPVTALVGQAVAWLGPMAIAALPSYGSIREKQILNDPQNNEDFKSKAVAALGAATVGAIETKFGPQNWALSAMTKEGREAVAKKFAETTLAKGIGFGAVKGAATEGAEELAQSPIEQLASYDDPTTTESLKDTAFGGAMGAIGGGVGGSFVGGLNVKPQPTIEDIGKAESVDDAIAAANAVIDAPIEMSPESVTASEIADLEQGAGMVAPEAADDQFEAPIPDVPELDDMIQRGATRDELFSQRKTEIAAREQEARDAGLDQLAESGRAQQVEQADALTQAQGFDTAEPTAMELAMQKAKDRLKLVTTPLSQRQANATLNREKLPSAPDAPETANDAPIQQAPVATRIESSSVADQTAESRGADETNQARVAATQYSAQNASLAAAGTSPAAQQVQSSASSASPESVNSAPIAEPAQATTPALTGIKAEVARIKAKKASVATPKDTASFTRSGDFWNYSGDRVAEIAKTLGTTITKRNGVPMVGIPNHAIERASQELRDAGIDAAFGKEQPVQQAAVPDRRKDSARRRAVAEMAPEEMRQALLTSDLTGIPNKRAFEEHVQANPKDNVLYGDLDDFKAMNTKYGHEGADQILRAVGSVKAQVAKSMGVTPYHRSGDEFIATNKDDATLKAYGDALQKKLAGATFEITMPDGSTVEHKGVGFSYGTGQDVKAAESKSDEQKAERKRLGLRVGQREAVPATEQGREDNQGDAGRRNGDTAADKQTVTTKEPEKSAVTPDVKAAPEPWQMTGAQWDKAREALRPNVAQSKFTKNSGSEAVGNMVSLEKLLYGVSSDARSKLKEAEQGKIKLSKAEVDDLLERVNARVSHRDVVEKAIAEGKSVPTEILAEYPGIQGNAKAAKPESKAQDRGAETATEEPAAPAAKQPRALTKEAAERLAKQFGEGAKVSPHPTVSGKYMLESKGQTATSGTTAAEVTKAISTLRAKWIGFTRINTVQSVADIPASVTDRFTPGAQTEGFYDPQTKSVYLIADNIASPSRAAWIASHEVVGHGGLRMLKDKSVNESLNLAGANRYIRDLAKAIKQDRSDVSDHIAVEEAVAETAAAVETGDFKGIKDRYGVDVPANIKVQQGLVSRVYESVKRFLSSVMGKPVAEVSDADVRDLIDAQRKAVSSKAVSPKASDRKAADQGDLALTSKGRNILKELSQHDELFRIKRSGSDTVEGITADIDSAITVKKLSNIPGETRYNFTLPDGRTARMMVRPWNKYGNSIYGFDLGDGEMSNMEDGRPGRNAEEADGKDDVWIDVSLLNEGGGYGAKIYAIAANYAHNTGKVFIGDPAGLSDEALIRRPEQMLSSALKFGTTEHLGPHPRQIKGDKALGIGPLDWVYGDDLGNIQKLIALNLANIENHGGNGDIAYDTNTGQFTDAGGNPITREDIEGLARAGLGREAQAGSATLARSALLRSLVQSQGGALQRPDGTLAALVEQLRKYGAATGTPLEDIFYSKAKGTSRDTVTVDGKERPTTNSNSKPIVGTEDGIKNFWKWFGDSKVVDADGKPLVVYHGTASEFDSFDGGRGGFYFTDDKKAAQEYADYADGDSDPRIVNAFLKMENPLVLNRKWFDENVMADGEPDWSAVDNAAYKAEENGHDGVILKNIPDYDGYVDGVRKEREYDQYIVFKPTQIKSAIGNSGAFDPSNASIMQSRAPSKVKSVWDAPETSKIDDVIYTMQDKMVDTRRVVAAIRKSIGDIADKWNPYLQEELFHGRSAKQVGDFQQSELRPLMQDMQMRKVEIPEFEEYLHMRHAEERNNQIAKVNPDMQDGGSGVDTADARDYLANLPAGKKRAYEALAKRVDAINKATRQLLIDSGLEKPETIKAWESAYQYYIPLQREESGAGIGQGFSVKGGASKRATGSKREVVNALANLVMQRERTIVRAEKNRVSTALYGLAIQSPNPEFWLPVNPEKATQKVADELVKLGMNPVDAQNLIDEPKQTYIDPRTGLVAERINPVLRSASNVMSTRIGGEDRYVFFSENDERAVRMVTALKNLDADQLGRVLSMSAKVTRYFSAINTQYNPIFGGINLIRDTQGAMLNLSTTPIAGKQKAVLAHTLSALRGIYIDLRDHRAGEKPNSTWATLYEEFQREGGQTGYRDMFATSKDRTDALENELNPDAWMDSRFGKLFTANGTLKVPLSLATKRAAGVFNWLSDYNEAMENAVRLATYKVGKEQGMTNQRAASMAKNVTVNFNRKGQVATQAGALYAFFNASVQGTTRLAETMRGPAGKKIMIGGLLLGSMQALLLAAAGFDDDEPPEFIKSRNLVIPTGNGKYITIPMPLGFNLIPNISRLTTEFALSGFRKPTEKLAGLIDLFADTFNPIGNAGLSLQTIAPTAIDPLAALSENRDWTGKPIAIENTNGLAPKPGHLRTKDTASEISKTLSYWINLASGGTKYQPGMLSPTPDQLDYLIGQATGGVGREALKAEQTVTSGFTGEDLPLHKVPVLGRFYGDTQGQSGVASKFYDNLKVLNAHEAEIKGRRKDGGDVAGYMRENRDARLHQFANTIERDVQQLRQRKRELLEKNASKERVKLIEGQINSKMNRLNDRMQKIKEDAPD